MLCKTEYGAFSTRIKSPRLEARQSNLPHPARDPEQRRTPAARGVRRGIHGMGRRTLSATTARNSINARKPRWVVLWVALRSYRWVSLRIDRQSKSDRYRGMNARKGVDTTEELLTALCSSYCCGVPSSTETNRHTSCPGSRAGAPVCQRANPTVAVVRYSWCRA